MPKPNRKKAEALARLLFPDDIYDGINCRREIGRLGEECSICLGREESWNYTIHNVHEALKTVFAKPTPP